MLRIISGKYKGRRIMEADKALTRPTTDKNKEMVFNVLGQYFQGGTALDLFAGSGAMGIEALSRGMEKCWFVDKNRQPFLTVRGNLEALKIGIGETAFLFQEEYSTFLKAHKNLIFDLIFLDPPYAMAVIPAIIGEIAEGKLLSSGGVIVAETDKMTAPPAEIGDIILFREVVEGHSRFAFYRWRDES